MTGVVGVITFPGSNGDMDAFRAIRDDLGAPVRLVDYRETDLSGIQAVILPGGFSYGDHLRCGAIARFAPVMNPVAAFAKHGGPVLGICNGFQILTEAHLLPGALRRNKTLRFHCHWTHVRVERTSTAWTDVLTLGSVLRLPIAHGEGAYVADAETVAALEQHDQVVARYCDPLGNVTDEANANGSIGNIAGICNAAGNVVGLMPHPERASNRLIGGDDGVKLLRGALEALHASV
jgi:phosphoribosylformylglycinamidine synthase I